MAKVVLPIKNYSSKFAAKMRQNIENHAFAGDSEHIISNSQN